MDGNTETSSRSGERTTMTTGSWTSGQLLPEKKMNMTAYRTCTQNITIPTLEKQDPSNESLRWRTFGQYVKMTKDVDLSTMTNTKEMQPLSIAYCI